VLKSLVNFKVKQVIVTRSSLVWINIGVAIIGSPPVYPPRVWAVSLSFYGFYQSLQQDSERLTLLICLIKTNNEPK
jgi:hypothetical protein